MPAQERADMEAESLSKPIFDRTSNGTSKALVAPLEGYFPATICPDVLDFKAWTSPRKPSLEQAVKLRDALKGMDLSTLDWKAYSDLADRTGMKPADVSTLI